MPFFHATFRANLPGIMAKGLGADGVANWPDVEKGVYLATHPAICLDVMIERYIRFGDPDSVPSEHLKDIVLIVVDDTRLRPDLLGEDSSIPRDDVRLYRGVVDVVGMPVLTVDDVLRGIECEAFAEETDLTPPRP